MQAKRKGIILVLAVQLLTLYMYENGWLVWHIRDELEIVCRYILLIIQGMK